MVDDSIVYKYFPDLNQEQKNHIAALGHIYQEWNARINVISRKDMDFFYERHVLHSLGIAKVADFNSGTHVLDVGTGGGFPGVPLAILFPKVQFHLVDSIGKKIKVVNEVVKTLGLTNVTAQQIRAEEVAGKYDTVVSRAVTRILPFYQWVKGKIKPRGNILYLKGGDIREEMQELKKNYTSYPLKDFFDEPFFDTKLVVKVTL